MSAVAYTSAELIGIGARGGWFTPRMLQMWSEKDGFVIPEIQGHRRLYSPAQAAMVLIVAAFKKKGVGLQTIRFGLPAIEAALKDRRGPARLKIGMTTKGHTRAWWSGVALLTWMVDTDAAIWLVDAGELLRALPDYPGWTRKVGIDE